MKPVVMVMAVLDMDAGGKQSVTCTLGLGDGETFNYLGSLNCTFEQFGIVNSFLKKVPVAFLTYKNDKWEKYIADIMRQLKECL